VTRDERASPPFSAAAATRRGGAARLFGRIQDDGEHPRPGIWGPCLLISHADPVLSRPDVFFVFPQSTFSRRLKFQGILLPPCKLLTLPSLYTMRKPLLLLAHLAILRGCLGKCYYPDGTLAPGDIPCDPDAENSSCCSAKSGDAFGCLANKLCRMPSGRNVRGSCTDPTWMSPDCPKFCTSTSFGRHLTLIIAPNQEA